MDTCVFGVIHLQSSQGADSKMGTELLYEWNECCARHRCFLALHKYSAEFREERRNTWFYYLPEEARAFDADSVCFELRLHPFSVAFEPEPHDEFAGPRTPSDTQLAIILANSWSHAVVQGIFVAITEGGWGPQAVVYDISFDEAMKHYYDESRLGAFAEDFAYLIRK